MPDPKIPPDVEIESEPEIEEIDEQVVVDLEAKPAKQADPPKPEVKASSVDLSKLHNTIAYQNRKLEQAMRELQQTRAEIEALRKAPTVQTQSQTLDDIDEIAQRDWKLGVKKVVEKDIESKVQEIISRREQAIQETTKRNSLEAELERSKQKVLTKYPTIEDEGSEESNLYRQVINEDPTILSNVHGPEIAMYRMEEKMRETGKTPPSVKPIIEREVNRLTRAGASTVVGRQHNPSGKITLSKDQKEFCDHYAIPYEQYAKNLRAQETLGGVEA